jgi:hypothetical protein
METVYEVTEKPGMGKVVVCRKGVLPGEVILVEHKPLMRFSEDSIDQAAAGEAAPLVAAYTAFLAQPADIQCKILLLFGPTNGCMGDYCRNMARALQLDVLNRGEVRPLNETEIELFTQVSCIYRLNSFVHNSHKCLFETLSRLSHSCIPNCHFEFNENGGVLRAILPVPAGEELTIEYNEYARHLFTHERRHNYAQKKDFTCHCPRCDAVGDELRQFPCSVQGCTGQHLVCQPLSSKPVAFADFKYTGVEYTEPRLLPCNVCGAECAVQRQAELLQLEVKLSAVGETYMRMLGETPELGVASLGQLVSAEKELRPLNCPPQHVLMLPILRRLSGLKLEVYRLRKDSGSAKIFTDAALQFVRLYERVTQFPCQQLMDELYNASAALAFPAFDTNWAQAKEYAAKALRMHLILYGREVRETEYDAHLLKILTKVKYYNDLAKSAAEKKVAAAEGSGDSNSAGSTAGSDVVVDAGEKKTCALVGTTSIGLCGFCEESPVRAAVKLSVCGRCKQIAYCSQGCQKAHWKLHKAVCGK